MHSCCQVGQSVKLLRGDMENGIVVKVQTWYKSCQHLPNWHNWQVKDANRLGHVQIDAVIPDRHSSCPPCNKMTHTEHLGKNLVLSDRHMTTIVPDRTFCNSWPISNYPDNFHKKCDMTYHCWFMSAATFCKKISKVWSLQPIKPTCRPESGHQMCVLPIEYQGRAGGGPLLLLQISYFATLFGRLLAHLIFVEAE